MKQASPQPAHGMVRYAQIMHTAAGKLKYTQETLDRTTLDELERNTPPEVEAKAASVSIVRRFYETGTNDGFRRTYVKFPSTYNQVRVYTRSNRRVVKTEYTDSKTKRVRTRSAPSGSGRQHLSIIRFYGPPGGKTPCWVWCDCEAFCVSGNARISTPIGNLPIKDTVGKISTFTRTGSKPGVTFSTGIAATIQLRTSDGFLLRATPNERFLLLTPELTQEWRRLDEIKPGDFVALKPGAVWPKKSAQISWEYQATRRATYKRRIAGKVRRVKGHDSWCNKTPTPAEMTPELARILGYLVSEGNGDRNTVSFTQNEGPVFDEYVRIWEKTFPGSHLILGRVKDGKGRSAVCRSVYLSAFFRDALGHDPSKHAKEKCVPDIIWKSKREHVIEFLHAYFEGDGCNIGGKQITCSTAAKRLGKDLQQLLFAVGVRFSRRLYYPSHPYESNKQYSLTAGGGNAVKFMTDIGFITKNDPLLPSTGSMGRKFPYARKVIRDCVKTGGYYTVKGKRVRLMLWMHNVLSDYGSWGHCTDSLTEYSLHNYLNSSCGDNLKIVYPDKHRRLDALLDSDLEWTEVKSIGSPKRVATYDATIPDGHNFVANGFVVHNTFSLEVALTSQNSSSVKNSNGENPDVRNPLKLGWLCKHLLVAARWARSMSKDLANEKYQKEEQKKADEKETSQKLKRFR